MMVNLTRDADYPDTEISWFYSVPPGKLLYHAFNQATTSSLHVLCN
jgi:hypothetical protein